MNTSKLLVLLFSCFLFCLPSLFSQSSIQSIGFPAEQNSRSDMQLNFPDGQTFKATSTSKISAISIKMNAGNGYVGMVSIWLGVEPGNGNKIGGAAYQTFDITAANQAGIVTINLNVPFPITTGNTYRMEFAPLGGGNMAVDANDITIAPTMESYADGMRTDNGNYETNRDLNFSLTLTTQKIIPTFSQWTLLIFSLLILNLGIFFTWQMKLK